MTEDTGFNLQYLLSLVDQANDALEQFISGLKWRVYNAVEDYISRGNVHVGAAGQVAIGTITRYWEEAGSIVVSIFDQVLGAVQSAVDFVVAQANFISDKIVGLISDIAKLVDNTWQAIITKIQNGIATAVNFATEVVNGIVDTIYNAIDDVINAIEGGFNSLADKIDALITSVTSFADSVYNDIVTYFSGLIEDFTTTIGDFVDGITEFITSEIDQTWEQIQEYTAPIADFIENLPSTFFQLADSIKLYISNELVPILQAAPEHLLETARDAIEAQLKVFAPEVRTTLEGIMELAGIGPDTWEISGLSKAINSVTKLLYLAIFAIIVGPLLFWGMIQTSLIAPQTQLAQRLARVTPYKLLAPPDAIAAFRRGFITHERMEHDITGEGFDTARVEELRLLDTLQTNLDQDITFWLRGFISEDELTERMHQLGFLNEDIPLLKRAAFFIPPVQDIITMAVREAFSPDVVAANRQDDDFPPQFAEIAAQQGVSEEFARYYWRAHWRLPSLTDAFEMFHRRVINLQQLEDLMRAQDVMPAWRDRLIQIAYSPFTRVDVRRMHKIGILDDEQVKSAYMDLGYDDEKSQALLEFTKIYNTYGLSLDQGEAPAISRSQIERFYKLGAIDHETAITLLAELGYNEDDRALIMSALDIEQELEDRQDLIDAIIERASSGGITLEDAQTEFNKLNLTQGEIRKAVTTIERNITRNTVIPSKDDLDLMLTKKVINVDDYRNAMVIHGYSDDWINRYLKLLGIRI